MTKQSKELNGLKAVYQIQTNGLIQNLLRDLRNSKNLADEFAKNIAKHKQEILLAEQQKEKELEEQKSTEVVQEKATENIEEKEVAQVLVPEKQEEKVEEQTFENKKSFSSSQQKETSQNTYQTGSNQQEKKSFESNKKFDNQKSFDKKFDQNKKPFDRQQKPFDRSRDKKGFAPKDKTGQKQFSSTFIPSKSNNVKVFLENINVLSQPERSFGNKNKSQRNLEEKVKPNLKKLNERERRNIIIDEDGEIEEATMGSKKLIKTKKKTQVHHVAPAIEHAVITTQTVTVKTLSEKIGKPVAEIIKKLMILGIMATINSSIDFTTAELVSSELGVTLELKLEQTAEEQLLQTVAENENEEDLVKRPPVVTIMGHVDHGKTSLLDTIRKTNVVSSEAGGITQKIGAYQVSLKGEKITFIDTPGHAAFTAMRARGAKITDIAILVVAADDGIMPQTIEAINHIKAANVPMIVAINKIDKEDANPERIKQQLTENGILPEEWGGDTMVVPVSAKTGYGIENLLESILLLADILELKANPKKLATGVIIEAELDKNKGPVATVLIQNGTLKVGDNIFSGIIFGKVKAMYDENGNTIKQASPSTPVAVLGFSEVPESGDQVFVVSEKLSKQVIEERKSKIKEERARLTSGVSLDNFMNKVNEGKLKNLNIIIKADTQGSVEALKQSLTAISNEEVRIVCVHSGVGAVTESDLILAKATKALVVNFNLKIASKIKTMSDSLGVEIKDCNIIYEIVEQMTDMIKGMLTVKYEKQVVGRAEIRAVFKLSSGIIAGCYVLSGKVIRNGGVRVLRNDEEIAETQIEALRIQKEDKAEVAANYECGIKLKDFTAFKEGDILEVYQNVKIER